MKKLILFASIIGLSFATAQAQELQQKDNKAKIEQKVDRETKILKKELALDEKQEVLVKKKIQEFALKRQEILNSGEPKAELHKRVETLENKKLNELREVLDQKQYDHLKKIKETRQNRTIKKRGKSNRLRSKTMSKK